MPCRSAACCPGRRAAGRARCCCRRPAAPTSCCPGRCSPSQRCGARSATCVTLISCHWPLELCALAGCERAPCLLLRLDTCPICSWYRDRVVRFLGNLGPLCIKCTPSRTAVHLRAGAAQGARPALFFCQHGAATVRIVQTAPAPPVKGSKEKQARAPRPIPYPIQAEAGGECATSPSRPAQLATAPVRAAAA